MIRAYEQIGILEVIKDKLILAQIEARQVQESIKNGKGIQTASLIGLINDAIQQIGKLE